MTNRLLATVMAFAVSTGLVAHAAQDKHQILPLPKLAQVYVLEVSQPAAAAAATTPHAVALPSTTSVPQAVQSAANHVIEAATAAVDPSAAVRAAFQRDHLALEHLRQQGSGLKGQARQAFNQRISNAEIALVEMEKVALASKIRPSTSISAMDQLVASMKTSLDRDLSHSGDKQTGDHNHQSNN
ncbi:MAG TPA: hypothetical protein VGD57_00950 [Candidatus Dormibacteraeota bacterium]